MNQTIRTWDNFILTFPEYDVFFMDMTYWIDNSPGSWKERPQMFHQVNTRRLTHEEIQEALDEQGDKIINAPGLHGLVTYHEKTPLHVVMIFTDLIAATYARLKWS